MTIQALDKDSLQVNYLVEITLRNDGPVLYLADTNIGVAGITYEDFIESVSGLTEEIRRNDSAFLNPDIVITLMNDRWGLYNYLIELGDAYPFDGAACVIKELYYRTGSPVTIFAGVLDQPQDITLRSFTVRCSSRLFAQESAWSQTVIDKTTWPNAADIGATENMIYGEDIIVPALRVDWPHQTTLKAAITDVQTTDIELSLYDTWPSSGNITIEDEELSYTGITNGILSGVTRGVNGTTGAAHALGAVVVEVKNAIIAQVAGHLCTEVGDIYAILNNSLSQDLQRVTSGFMAYESGGKTYIKRGTTGSGKTAPAVVLGGTTVPSSVLNASFTAYQGGAYTGQIPFGAAPADYNSGSQLRFTNTLFEIFLWPSVLSTVIVRLNGEIWLVYSGSRGTYNGAITIYSSPGVILWQAAGLYTGSYLSIAGAFTMPQAAWDENVEITVTFTPAATGTYRITLINSYQDYNAFTWATAGTADFGTQPEDFASVDDITYDCTIDITTLPSSGTVTYEIAGDTVATLDSAGLLTLYTAPASSTAATITVPHNETWQFAKTPGAWQTSEALTMSARNDSIFNIRALPTHLYNAVSVLSINQSDIEAFAIKASGHMADSSLYGTLGTAIKRPDHVIKHFLIEQIGFSADEIDNDSFEAAGLSYADSGYEFGFLINARISPTEWLKRMAFEARSTVKYTGGKWYLNYLPDEGPVSEKTVSQAEIAEVNGMFLFNRSPVTDLINDVTARFKRNYIRQGNQAEFKETSLDTSEDSIALYGRRPLNIDFEYIRLQAVADDRVQHILRQQAYSLLTVIFPADWEHFDLLVGTTFRIDSPLYSSRKFYIETVKRLDKAIVEITALEWWGYYGIEQD